MIFIALGAFALGVALNALFAGYETGFLSADPIRMRFLAEEDDDARAKYLVRHLNNKRHLLTTVLIGTNIALILGTAAITFQVGGLWATVIATPVFLIFSEIVPKTIFRRHPTRLALALLPAIRFFDILMAPLVWPTMACSTLLLKLIGSPVARSSASTSMPSIGVVPLLWYTVPEMLPPRSRSKLMSGSLTPTVTVTGVLDAGFIVWSQNWTM